MISPSLAWPHKSEKAAKSCPLRIVSLVHGIGGRYSILRLERERVPIGTLKNDS